MGCGTGLAKTILIGVNVVFFLAGAAILGGALYVRFEPNIQTYAKGVGIDIITEQLFIAAYILIAFGAVTLVVGLCGCYGAIKDSKCALGIYIAAIVLIMGAEIGGGVFIYAIQDQLISELSDIAGDYLQHKYENSKDSADDEAWNLFMTKFECCGFLGVSDFKNSSYSRQTGQHVPDVCCIKSGSQCQADAGKDAETSSALYTTGCLDAFKRFLKSNSVLLLGIAGGVAGFELLVMLMAICVCCGIKDEDRF